MCQLVRVKGEFFVVGKKSQLITKEVCEKKVFVKCPRVSHARYGLPYIEKKFFFFCAAIFVGFGPSFFEFAVAAVASPRITLLSLSSSVPLELLDKMISGIPPLRAPFPSPHTQAHSVPLRACGADNSFLALCPR